MLGVNNDVTCTNAQSCSVCATIHDLIRIRLECVIFDVMPSNLENPDEEFTKVGAFCIS